MSTEVHYPPAVRPEATDLDVPGPKMLVAQATGHRILLPEDGELILGRLDPSAQDKADVDLTFEDRAAWGVSRRHARITGWRGRYEIEDLGSSIGTWVNEIKLALRIRQALQVGDEVLLGGCLMFFDRTPAQWKMPLSSGQPFLYATFSGRYFPLPPQDTILIGRADPQLEFTPDIDLGDKEEVIAVVSRRHAKLTWHGEQFMVEDMGSTFKTQLNGQQVYAGIKVPIRPGQHLWLGGYTLAFDIAEKPP